jgi:predicted nucleotidyltransferase
MTIQPVRDYSAYLPYARALMARRRTDPQLAARRERAWVTAREAARFLRETYRPARIRLFGSLLTPELFHAQSDIDLAVEGIPWPAYLRAWNDVERRFTEFKIDLIDLSVVSDRLWQCVEEQGVDL